MNHKSLDTSFVSSSPLFWIVENYLIESPKLYGYITVIFLTYSA
jgi:hypothetical protein